MTTELFRHHDRKFAQLIHGSARLDTHFDDCRWAEGPVWCADALQLIWSDIPNDRLMRWTPDGGASVFRANAHYPNGNTRDRQGRLITCSHGGRSVTRTELDGSITVLADRYRGGKLNSPNDVSVKSDGTIWFTDPDYGIRSNYSGNKGESEQAGCYVYCLDPATGSLKVVIDDMVRPNGIAFSPDESVLYVSDTGYSNGPEFPRHIRSFEVRADNSVGAGRVLYECEAGLPDGFRVDECGNIWTSAHDGVHCLNDAGALLGKILIPAAVANVEFGGARRNRLFICASGSLHSVYLAVSGARRP